MTRIREREKPGPTSHGEAVIDNTLFSRLLLLEIIDFLPYLYKRIRVPVEVWNEAARGRGKLKKQLANRLAEMKGFFVDCQEHDPMEAEFLKADLDAGEASAIAQASYLNADLLIDEQKGARRAENMSLRVVRTGRLLIMMKEAGAIEEVRPFLDRLKRSGFYLADEDRLKLLQEAGEEPKI